MAQLSSNLNNDQWYYTNPSEWGKDKYITLENVIDNIMIMADDDSYFKHVKRFRATIVAKQGLKHMNLGINSKNKAISFQLSPNKTFPYPRFMTDWIRVSVLNKCGKLDRLSINNNSSIQDYLQDHRYELLYDENGEVLRAQDFNSSVGRCFRVPCQTIDTICEDKTYQNGWVRDVQDGNYFEFSENLVDGIIIIEFKTAGMLELKACDIFIHHELELALENWTKSMLLKGKRNVPPNEWKTYWEFYKLHHRNAISALSEKITPEQMLKSIELRHK